MLTYRIIYIGDGLTPEGQDIAAGDLVAAAQIASSRHPHLTAEIWIENRKVAVIRPCSRHGEAH